VKERSGLPIDQDRVMSGYPASHRAVGERPASAADIGRA